MTEPTPKKKGGRASRAKGDRREREIVNAHKAIGVHAERVPLSGAAGGSFSGDVDVYAFGPNAAPLCCEVKARANAQGFAQALAWLGDNDALFLTPDRSEPYVMLPWRTWTELVSDRARRAAA